MASRVPSDSQIENFPPKASIPLGSPRQEDELAHGVVGPLDEVSIHASQLSFLVETSAALAAALDVEPVLESVLSRLTERERLSFARIYRVSEFENEVREVASDACRERAHEAIPLEDFTLLTWVIQQKQEVYIPRVDLDPRCQDWDGEKVKSAYVVPLRSGANLVGILEVGVNHPDGIRFATRSLVGHVANQAAQAFERDELFKQLRASEERFRSIFEHVTFGIVLAKLDGCLSKVNPAFARLLGSTCEELEGKHFAEITHPQDAVAIEGWIQQLRDGQATQVSLERRFLRKSGEAVWCAANISLLRDGPGNSSCFLGMVQDITARKHAEEEHNRLQQQLFQSQKMEALGTLAGGIAHDFNNLLSVMLGFASLARQRLEADDPLQDSMGMIEESAERAAELARQLLGLARPEKQQVKPVAVLDVVSRVRRMVERTFDRSIKVEVSHPHGSFWVNAEPSYLEQSLLNLCLNARDAMPKGGKLSIEVSSTSLDPPGEETSGEITPIESVSISVQDSGLGIAPGDLPRIFEPFFSTKAPGSGTGLGLAMVYGFVKNHGGEVKVESNPGKGSRFTMVLPKIPAPPPQATRDLVQVEIGSGTVLVVDDEPLVRAFASEGLKKLGYEVLLAENGAQAIETYENRQGKIDCVLLDLIMPEVSGLETYRKLRAIDPQVRVLFASGYSTGEILREAPDAQEAMFIGKPYSLANLAAMLRKAMASEKCCK